METTMKRWDAIRVGDTVEGGSELHFHHRSQRRSGGEPVTPCKRPTMPYGPETIPAPPEPTEGDKGPASMVVRRRDTEPPGPPSPLAVAAGLVDMRTL